VTYNRRLMDEDFQYTNSAKSKEQSYLRDKWDRLYPGWRNKPSTKTKSDSLIIPATIRRVA
jgi:hypothetical protein